ncbi:MAG: NAD(P)H-dependent oxidoreductase [Acidobacteria bacterium]|nr:NAD(P)H-dependent oxidoreductase [Acidobacteriota bacterium]
MSSKQRILILFAHPSPHRSEVNRPMFVASKSLAHVTAVDLYREYPTFCIDIDREQQRLREHDVLIFHFPLYWYSTPSLLKEWQDLVLEYGFAYGHEGKALAGKQFMCALSASGPEKAYHADGYNHFTIRELLQPLEQMADFVGMTYLPPFTLFGARSAVEDKRLSRHIAQWTALLNGLGDRAWHGHNWDDVITINAWVTQHMEERI